MTDSNAQTPSMTNQTHSYNARDVEEFLFQGTFGQRGAETAYSVITQILTKLGAEDDPTMILRCSLHDVKAATKVLKAVYRQPFISSFISLTSLARRNIYIPQEHKCDPTTGTMAESFPVWVRAQIKALTEVDIHSGEVILAQDPSATPTLPPSQASNKGQEYKSPRTFFQDELEAARYYEWRENFESWALIHVSSHFKAYTTPTQPDDKSDLPKELQNHLQGSLLKGTSRLPVMMAVRAAARGTDALAIIMNTYDTPASRALEKQKLTRYVETFTIAYPGAYEADTARYNSAINRLAHMGEPMAQRAINARFLEALPTAFEHIRLNIYSQLAVNPELPWQTICDQLRAMVALADSSNRATTQNIPVNEVKQGTKRKFTPTPREWLPFHKDYRSLNKEPRAKWLQDRQGYVAELKSLDYPQRGDPRAAQNATLRAFEQTYAQCLTASPTGGAFATFTGAGA